MEAIIENSPKQGFIKKKKTVLIMKDSYGMPPLCTALKHQAPIECVMFVLKACPKMTKEEDKQNRLALHIAMTHRVPNDPIILALVEKNKGAPKALDQWLRTPLHSGMEFRAQVNSVRTVLEKYPKAAKLLDSNNRYPLHLGMRFEAHKEAIDIVMKANKDAIDKKDKYDRTPLQEGLARRAPLNCIKILLAECTAETILHQDTNGKNCLHLGMEKNVQARIIELLLQKCPTLAVAQDKDGNSPLHLGMMHEAKLDCIKALLKVKPEATKLKNNDKIKPYGIGMQYGAPKNSLEALRKAEADCK